MLVLGVAGTLNRAVEYDYLNWCSSDLLVPSVCVV